MGFVTTTNCNSTGTILQIPPVNPVFIKIVSGQKVRAVGMAQLRTIHRRPQGESRLLDYQLK